MWALAWGLGILSLDSLLRQNWFGSPALAPCPSWLAPGYVGILVPRRPWGLGR